MKKMKFILILAIIPLFLVTASCGEDDELAGFGNSKHVKVRVFPTAPIVLHVDWEIPISTPEGITFWTFAAPNIRFRIEIDNKDGDRPITVLLAHALVTGPKDTKNVWITPGKMTVTDEDGNEKPQVRSFIVEVPPGRKSTCMHKVDYLGQTDTGTSCPGDLDEDMDDSSLCCPTSKNSTANSWIYMEKLQDMNEEELLDPNNVFVPYMFEGTLIGWFGPSTMPESNFRKRFYFQSTPL